METKTIRQRLRGLLCLWLTALLVAAMLIVPAAAAEPEAANWGELKALATESTAGGGTVYDFGGKTIRITDSMIFQLSGETITLKNAHFEVDDEKVDSAFLITGVSGDSVFQLNDIILDGGALSDPAATHQSCALAFTTSDGSLTAEISNSTLQNWSADGSYLAGGAVGIFPFWSSNPVTVNMTDSTISNCSSTLGGGVWLNPYGTFNMADSTITGCTAQHVGGGVNIGAHVAFTMTNSSITDCTAGDTGGGVYTEGDFYMTDSTITGCTAGTDGGGVYQVATSGANGKITLSGKAVISGNTANGANNSLYLAEYSGRVSIDSGRPLTADSSIGVTAGGTLPIDITDTNSSDYSDRFFADDGETQHIENSTDGGNVVWLAAGVSSYAVTLPSSQTGYTLAAKSGSASPVTYDGSYTFTFALDPAYSDSTPVIKVNGVAVTPDGNGEYTITNITEKQTVTVSGVKRNAFHSSGGSDNDTIYTVVRDMEAEGFTFTCRGEYDSFTGLMIDGKTVDKEDYTVVRGSTILTLKPEYAQTLTAGSHTLRMDYKDGYGKTTFNTTATGVEAAIETNPDTGAETFLDYLILRIFSMFE